MAAGGLSRRAFLSGAAAGGLLLGGSGLWTPARARVLRSQLRAIADPSGTTLASAIARSAGAGYRTLVEGPGWPTLVRAELAPADPGRADRREALAAIVHLTDIHLIDAQSPGRVEFLDRFGSPLTAAFRAQEALTAHVGSSMVQRIRSLSGAPITGRAFDCAVSTGDNIDNQQLNEAQWFLTMLDGGTLTVDSGMLGTYEGVQDGVSVDPYYWHPEPGILDDPKTTGGFPERPGMLAAAIAPFTTPSVGMPWYSTYGNHDGLVQGNLPRNAIVDQLLTGDRKILDLKAGQSASNFIGTMFVDPATLVSELEAGTYPWRPVTADAGRRTLTGRQWVQLHLDSPAVPGPVGHGYTEDHLELPAIYYDFPIAPGVLGISMDTGGYNSGSIGKTQLDWIVARLIAAHSSYWDSSGQLVRTTSTDQRIILFSHYGPGSMNQPMTDPDNPDEVRYLGDEVLAVLRRFPNVIAWVNGHHHQNRVTPMADPSGRTQGFWDINTASHVDWPQQARLVEVADNRDGTLSIFCTMLEHLADAVPAEQGTGVLDLASLSRELCANDSHSGGDGALGADVDLNVELLLADPLQRQLPPTTTSTTVPAAPPAPAVTGTPAYTG